MNLPPSVAALARIIRGDIRQIKEAIQQQTRATRDASEGAQQQRQTSPEVIVRTRSDEKFVVETHPNDQEGHAVQKKIMWATRAAVLAATIYAGIAAYQGWQMKKATMAAQKSADTAIRQLEVTDRPWIKAVPRSWSPLSFRDNGDLGFSVTFALSNIGRSVATDVTIYPSAFASPYGAAFFEEPVKRQTELCKKPHPEGLRITLFPDETKEFTVGVAISRVEMEANVVPPPPGMTNPQPPGKRFHPVLFGCVDYRFASLEKHHQTGFIYGIVRIDPKTPNVPYLIIIGQDLPANRVNLERWVFGGDYAN